MKKLQIWIVLAVVSAGAALMVSGCGTRNVAGSTGQSGGTSPAPQKTTPTLTWSQPTPISTSTPLSSTQLDAMSSVAGTFSYNPPAGTLLAAGTQPLVAQFTPTNTSAYNSASISVTITVNAPAPVKTTPTITWPQPAPITYPAQLSATQLDATASVAGTFSYSPAAGTVLEPGMQTLTADFTPTDTTDYNTATASVTITVNAAQTTQASQLAVADGQNNRVLIYGAPLNTDESASVVLGQADFVHGSQNEGGNPGANTLSSPNGLAMDKDGDLYVADWNNCRVVEYQPPFATNMNASVEVGQPGFTYTETQSCVANQAGVNTMLSPSGVTLDSDGNLWVADANAGRVTKYDAPLANGENASVSIGQTNLSNSYSCNGADLTNGPSPAPTASTLCGPFGATFDAEGNLWVADTGNQRVLEFKPPFITGMAASVEIGQPASTAFTSNVSNNGGISASSLYAPDAVAFDAAGDLWIADTGNDRVLEYTPTLTNGIATFTNGMAATLVIGQPGFTSANLYGAPAANLLNTPNGLNFDSNGNLIVDDNQNNRTLVFDYPFKSGMSATTVLGQPNMTSGTLNQGNQNAPGAQTLWAPSASVWF